jgi:hypothetical protein
MIASNAKTGSDRSIEARWGEIAGRLTVLVVVIVS